MGTITIIVQSTKETEPINHERVRVYVRSPRSLRARARSLGWMVTRLAWMAAKLVSSKSETRYASAATWSAMTADDWKRRSVYEGR